MTYSRLFSSVNQSDTSQLWVPLGTCMGKGQIALSSWYVMLPCDASGAAVCNEAFGWLHMSRRKHVST